MAETVKVDDLAKVVSDELDGFAGMLPDEIAEAQKAAAKRAQKQLRSTSPEKTGTYAKNWKIQTTKTRTGATTQIYQGKKPGLTHLLEYGHPIVSGGRVAGQAKAFPHIADANAAAQSAFEEELRKRLENGT